MKEFQKQNQVDNQNLILESNLKILSPYIIITLIFSFAVSIITLLFVRDSANAEFIGERVLIISGILLFTPLFSAENNENLNEIIVSKFVKYKKAIYIRYICGSIILTAVILIYILLNINKITTVYITFINTVCISFFLGHIGLFLARTAKKAVLGYMASFGIYAVCMFSETTSDQSILFPPVGKVNINLLIIFIITLILSVISLCNIKNKIT